MMMTNKGFHKSVYSSDAEVIKGKSDPLTSLKSLISPISSNRSAVYDKLVSQRRRKCFFDDSENHENDNTINLKNHKQVLVEASPRPLKRASFSTEKDFGKNQDAEPDPNHLNFLSCNTKSTPPQSDVLSPGKELNQHIPKKLSESFLSPPPPETSSHKASRNLLMSAEKRSRELQEISITSGNLLDSYLLKSAEKRNSELKEIAMVCSNILSYKYPLP